MSSSPMPSNDVETTQNATSTLNGDHKNADEKQVSKNTRKLKDFFIQYSLTKQTHNNSYGILIKERAIIH